ncbi:MAG TPA: tripartite tricarboxylate transporter substrate binding protein [Burkholderiales bacterium]|nr:tripartite tricarboxylate transporter substrate binding protein [Burkholderiales bacterium]
MADSGIEAKPGNRMISRHILSGRVGACLTVCAWAVLALASHAAEYPTRPTRLLVPTSPGGGTDALARILAPRLGQVLGHQWVVDNRAGAGGNIAVELVAKAVPDGYTVIVGLNHVTTVNPNLYKLSYDVQRDLQPVTSLAGAQYLLVLNPGVPAGTLKEFIALAKQKPGSLNYASAGIGTPVHLAAELFKKRVGVDMVHIAYKGGGPAAAAVLAGEAQVIFGSVASTMPLVRAGRLKALATTGIRRSKVAPELPTVAESGYPGFDVRSWYAMLATAGTPMAIVNRIHDAVVKVVGLPEVEEAMSRQGLEPELSTPQELAARIRKETAMWAEVIKTAGIKAE